MRTPLKALFAFVLIVGVSLIPLEIRTPPVVAQLPVPLIGNSAAEQELPVPLIEEPREVADTPPSLPPDFQEPSYYGRQSRLGMVAQQAGVTIDASAADDADVSKVFAEAEKMRTEAERMYERAQLMEQKALIEYRLKQLEK